MLCGVDIALFFFVGRFGFIFFFFLIIVLKSSTDGALEIQHVSGKFRIVEGNTRRLIIPFSVGGKALSFK